MSTDVIAGVAPVLDDGAPKTAGLFSPPDSNKRMAFDDSDSELSELDDEGYSIGALPKMGGAEVAREVKEEGRGGDRMEDGDVGREKKDGEAAGEKEVEVDDIGEVVPDHYADEGRVPVFKPTMHQFKDFQVYVRFPATRFSCDAVANVFADGPHQQIRHAIRHCESSPTTGMARQPAGARRNYQDDSSSRADQAGYHGDEWIVSPDEPAAPESIQSSRMAPIVRSD
jgi:hypothetical protein